MERSTYRLLSLIFLFGFGGWMIYQGFQGWVFARSEMPLQYVGYLVVATGVLGICGVNVWYGGPLDRRNDPS